MRNVFISINRSVPTPNLSSWIKAAKRKSITSEEMPQKIVKQHLIQQVYFTVLKELSLFLKELKQPEEIYQTFSNCCKDESFDTTSFLT